MKHAFNLVFMGEAEYWADLCRTSVDDDKMYLTGFNAGKFHAAGGYGKSLVATKAKLKDATALLEKWRPLVEALETTKGQFTEIP